MHGAMGKATVAGLLPLFGGTSIRMVVASAARPWALAGTLKQLGRKTVSPEPALTATAIVANPPRRPV